jgi:hypothetical protein
MAAGHGKRAARLPAASVAMVQTAFTSHGWNVPNSDLGMSLSSQNEAYHVRIGNESID